jgi:hypothetical protein
MTTTLRHFIEEQKTKIQLLIMGLFSRLRLAAILQCFALNPAESFQQSLYKLQRRGEIVTVSRSSSFGRVSSSLHSENPASSNENGASGGGLMSFGDSLKSQLASAFSALDESDQYDAVLTGLCAKVLDNPSVDSDQVVVALQDPIRLMEEMNSRRIKAGSRSLMALIDVRLCACTVSFCYAGYAFF